MKTKITNLENPFRIGTHNYNVFDRLLFKKLPVNHRIAVDKWDCNRLPSRIQNIEDKLKELGIKTRIKTKSIFISGKMFTEYYL